MATDLASLLAELRDLRREVRELQGGQRSGLSSVALSSGSAGYTISTYGTENWQDDAAGGTTPQVTLETGRRVAIFACYRPLNVGINVGAPYTWRSRQGVMGVQIDSTEPHLFPLPPMRSQFSLQINTVGSAVWVPFTLATFRADLVPGEHTFTVRYWAEDTTGVGTDIDPVMTDQFLMVFPLGPG